MVVYIMQIYGLFVYLRTYKIMHMKLLGKMITIAGVAASLVSCSDKAAKED